MRKRVAAMVLLLALAGCGGGGEPESSPSPSGPPTEGRSYGSLADLRDAVTATGYECDWVQEDQVALAAESGSCTDADVLMVFASESSRDEQIAAYKDLAEVTSGETFELVGPNWLIHHSDDREAVESIRADLGGIVQVSKA